MSELAIEMTGISKWFGCVQALRDVSFRARHGEVHALVGENGAGKSTLVRILSGVHPAGSYGGTVRVNGMPVELRSPYDARTKGIGYVPQEISVIDSLTVAENILVGRTGRGGGPWVSQRELEDRAGRLLRDLGIELDPRLPAGRLPASQKQLMMIARALAAAPSVLTLDEATACLTHREAGGIFELVHRLRSRGQCCIFVSHRLPEVLDLADRVTVLRDGVVSAELDRDRFTREDLVRAMVGGLPTTPESLQAPRSQPAGGEPILRVEGLTVPHPWLAGRNVVEDVTFEVGRGEIVGLGGLVGSGRSEVLGAVYGRLEHRGRIFVDGRPMRITSPRRARRAGIALLTEDRKLDGLLFNFDIGRNITIGSLPAVSHAGFIDRGAETRHAGRFLRELSIRAASASTPVASLSGGNQQKVILARLLLAQPRILLLDEPTKGVDVGAKAEIHRIIRNLARAGAGIVLVSSELPELLSLGDRIVVLARGRVTGVFARGEATEGRVMLAATGLATGAGGVSPGEPA